MAIASGTPVPPVYLLGDEDGINAFAAGSSPSDAVIGVSRGCVRLLSREALYQAIEPQPEAEGRSVLPINMHWSLGYHGVPTSHGFPKQAFGHFGFGGSGAWADPSRELSLALTVNCGTGTPLGDLRIVRLGGAALAAAGRRDGRYVSPAAQQFGDSWSRARDWFDRRSSASYS